MASKLTAIILAVALLSLLCCNGSAAASDGDAAAAEWVPMQPTAAAVVVPEASITLRNCDRCTCCSKGNPGICQTMQCCMESVCTPGQGCSAQRPATCGCDTNTCVYSN